MFEKVRGIIADQLDKELEEITPQSRIQEDLGADSLDMYNIITDVESLCGADLDSADVYDQITTVQSLLDLLENQR